MSLKLTDIIKNPFRILDVYADASQKEIVARKGKLSALASVSKSAERELCMEGLMGAVECGTGDIENAYKQLHLPASKVKYALMWFMQPQDDKLRKSLQTCDSKNVDGLLSKFETCLSSQNENPPMWLLQDIMVLSLIARKYEEAYLFVSQMACRVPEWLKCVDCEVVEMQPTEFVQTFLDIMKQYDIRIDIEKKLKEAYDELDMWVNKIYVSASQFPFVYEDSKRLLPLLRMAPKGMEHYYVNIANTIAERILDYCLLIPWEGDDAPEIVKEYKAYAESIMYGASLLQKLRRLDERISNPQPVDTTISYSNTPDKPLSSQIATWFFAVLPWLILLFIFLGNAFDSPTHHSRDNTYSPYVPHYEYNIDSLLKQKQKRFVLDSITQEKLRRIRLGQIQMDTTRKTRVIPNTTLPRELDSINIEKIWQ